MGFFEEFTEQIAEERRIRLAREEYKKKATTIMDSILSKTPNNSLGTDSKLFDITITKSDFVDVDKGFPAAVTHMVYDDGSIKGYKLLFKVEDEEYVFARVDRYVDQILYDDQFNPESLEQADSEVVEILQTIADRQLPFVGMDK